ncbi:MFS domain-containing protein [Mycena venus]|uniref:MFS domain-containing protein n=1 Tax=Mycena venus TaxID=2733690 RepID=A0A8H6XN62_9AGAR|nr:MFS domain-containing protein [Mycena venus]
MASPPSPQALLAPYYLGTCLNTFLYGILVIQTLFYFQNYKSDKIWLRFFVLYLFTVETLNTALCVAMIYEPLVKQFGTDLPTSLFPSLLPSQPFLEAAIFVPVQFFYAWRIWIIMRNYFAPVLICMASLSSLVGAVWTAIIVNQVKSYSNKAKVDHTALVWSCSAAVADIIITTSLIWSLRMKKTGIKRTDDVIDRILRTSIQTGGLTVAFTILDVALFVALPNSTLSFVFDFAIPKLYSNALISTFNVRSTGRPETVDLATQAPHESNNMLFLETNQQVATSATIVFTKPSPTEGQFDGPSDILGLSTAHPQEEPT